MRAHSRCHKTQASQLERPLGNDTAFLQMHACPSSLASSDIKPQSRVRSASGRKHSASNAHGVLSMSYRVVKYARAQKHTGVMVQLVEVGSLGLTTT